MVQGPIEELVAEVGFDYDAAAIRSLDAQLDTLLGVLEIVAQTAGAVSKHLATSMRAAGIPVDALEESTAALGHEFEEARAKAKKLRTEVAKVGDEEEGAGDKGERAGREIRQGAEEAGDGVGDLLDKLGLVAGVLAAIELGREMFEQARQVRILSQSMGIAVESASEWSAVARTVGAEAEDIQDGMVTLAERFLDAANGGQDAKDMLTRLGLEIPRTTAEIPDAEEGFLQLADSLAAIENPAERAAKASGLLGDNGVRLLPFLSRGRRGIEEMRRRVRDLGGGLSSDGVEQFERFQGSIVFVQVAMESLFDVFAKKVLPIFSDLVDHGADVIGFLRGAAENSHIFESAIVTLIGLAAVFGASWLAAMGPVILAIGAIALVAAAIDDMWVGMEGGQSLIGDWLDETFGDGTAAQFFQTMREGWDSLVGFVTGTVAPYFRQFWNVVKGAATAAFTSIRNAIMPLVEMLTSMWDRIREPVTNIVGFIFRAFRAAVGKIIEIFGGVIDVVSEIIQSIVWFLDRIGLLDALGGLGGLLDRAGEAAAGTTFASDQPADGGATGDAQMLAGGGGTRNVEQTNNANIEVNLPPGVTPEEARRIARQAAEGVVDAQNESLLDLEATA